jgi:hypothetical protein
MQGRRGGISLRLSEAVLLAFLALFSCNYVYISPTPRLATLTILKQGHIPAVPVTKTPSASHEDQARFLHVLAAQRRYPCVWWSQAAQARRRAQVTRSVIVLSQFQSKIDDALHVEFGALTLVVYSPLFATK